MREVRTFQKHYDRFNDFKVFNIMEDGFSYVYTFDRLFDEAYYTVNFFWTYANNSTDENYSVYMPPVTCSTEHFQSDILQRMQDYDMGSGLICPDIGSLSTQIKMIGDKKGISNSSLYSQVYYRKSNDYCKDINEVQAYVDFMYIRYITTNTYYDYSAVGHHIENYIWSSDQMFYALGEYNIADLRVVPSLINFINGSSSMVYETKDNQINNYKVDNDNNAMLFLSVVIDPHYFIYQEYYNYQPVFKNSTRQLNQFREVRF